MMLIDQFSKSIMMAGEMSPSVKIGALVLVGSTAVSVDIQLNDDLYCSGECMHEYMCLVLSQKSQMMKVTERKEWGMLKELIVFVCMKNNCFYDVCWRLSC